jgi:hypothetical protein
VAPYPGSGVRSSIANKIEEKSENKNMKNINLPPQYRAIVRFSLDHDDNSNVRNNVIGKLHKAGFQNTKTGAWETSAASLLMIQKYICAAMDEIAALTADVNSPMTLDHIWLYIDKV